LLAINEINFLQVLITDKLCSWWIDGVVLNKCIVNIECFLKCIVPQCTSIKKDFNPNLRKPDVAAVTFHLWVKKNCFKMVWSSMNILYIVLSYCTKVSQDPLQLSKWMKALNITSVDKEAFVCSRHFSPEMFGNTNKSFGKIRRIRLPRFAYPTKFVALEETAACQH
jgi:hypothetical protein